MMFIYIFEKLNSSFQFTNTSPLIVPTRSKSQTLGKNFSYYNNLIMIFISFKGTNPM